MAVHRCLIILVVACLGCVGSVCAADEPAAVDVNALFDELFGADERAAAATNDIADDLVLVNRILAACRQLSEPQAFREHLCDRAYRIAARRTESVQAAADALELLIEVAPARTAEARERMVDLYTQAYRRNRGETRIAAGGKLIDWCMRFGDEMFLDRQYDAAMQMYQRAEAVARSINSDQRDALNLRATSANAMQNATSRLTRLADGLRTTDKPRALNTDLAKAALRELADFDAAAWYAQSADDPELAKMIRLARRQPDKLNSDELMQAGNWLTDMANGANDYAKSQLLRRAMRMYSQYRQQPELDEVHRLLGDTKNAAAKRLLDELKVPHIVRRPKTQ